MNEGQELVEAPETAIQPFSKFDAEIADFKEMNFKMKFDIETYEGETNCKKYLARVGKIRTGVEALRKSIKKEFLDKGRAVDDEAKAYQAIIAEIDAVHSVPLKALETKRLNEVLEAQEAVKAKERKEEAARIADLEEREAKMAAKEAEQDAADREEELLKARLEAAKVTKRQAEQEAILAKGIAEQEQVNAVLEAEQKAKAEAAAKAKEIADKYAAEQAAKDEQVAIDQARAANEEHRRDFNNQAVDKLVAITGSNTMSMDIVKAIVKGEIPNITMNY